MSKEAFMEGAWASFVQWAWSEPKMREAYETHTREKLFVQVGSSPLDRMIDSATGYNKAKDEQISRFVDWVTIHHWGVKDAPEAWRKAKAIRPVMAGEGAG